MSCSAAVSQYRAAYHAARREEHAELRAAYRASHREEEAARGAKYYAAHREEIAARTAAHSAAHREERREEKRAYQAAYFAAHREKIAARTAAYRAEHLEEYAAYSRNRHALENGNGGTHTAEDVRAQHARQKGLCYWCLAKVGDTYHVDHVMPVILGGSNGPENLVIACPACNCSKSAQHPMDFCGRLL